MSPSKCGVWTSAGVNSKGEGRLAATGLVARDGVRMLPKNEPKKLMTVMAKRRKG